MSSSKNRGCQGLNRTQHMKKDALGFYEITLGRYGIPSVHSYKIWHLEEAVIASVQRKAETGRLMGELGLPGPPNGTYWSNEQFLRRVKEIRQDNVVCLYKDISIELQGEMQIVKARMRPIGPQADGLQLIIDQGTETLVFGHRAMMKAGTGGAHLEQIVTWDLIKIKEQPTKEEE